MMQGCGFDVVEYGNYGSESEAKEKVEIFSEREFASFFPHQTTFHGDLAIAGSPAHVNFELKLVREMMKRVEPGDIICHPFGHAHSQLLVHFPHNLHVETGIGYPTTVPGTVKVYESYAWMHYHQGKENRNGNNYEYVVPNYYDLDDWKVQLSPGKYLSFLGRVTETKGFNTLLSIAEHSPYTIVVCGQGDPTPWIHPNITYLPPLTGSARSDFLGNSRALLAPSVFTEPFCGMAVEAMLCGTPVISVDYGAMTETVQEGMGFRCHTLKDWLEAIEAVSDLDREFISSTARSRYSLETCGAKYARMFKQIENLYSPEGWYKLS